MSVPFEIPLSPNAQRFAITLAAVDYYMQLVWNSFANAWILDIADTDNTPLVQGIPLVTGVNLLEQFAYLGFAGGLLVVVDTGIGEPTFANLGTVGHLYFVTLP